MSMSQNPYIRSDWRDQLDRMEARLEPFLQTTPHGEKYIDTDNTPGPLLSAYNALVTVGLEHGWMTLEEDA